MVEDWITTAEAAKLSGYHPDHLRRLLVAGKIKARKFSGVWQVSRADLLQFMRLTEQAGKKRGPKPRA